MLASFFETKVMEDVNGEVLGLITPSSCIFSLQLSFFLSGVHGRVFVEWEGSSLFQWIV